MAGMTHEELHTLFVQRLEEHSNSLAVEYRRGSLDLSVFEPDTPVTNLGLRIALLALEGAIIDVITENNRVLSDEAEEGGAPRRHPAS